MDDERRHIEQFLAHCHTLVNEARFIITSFPNAEMAAVERSSHQLRAIRTIILSINDAYISQEDIEAMLETVDAHLRDLEDFLDHPPPPLANYIPRHYTGLPGRPAYALDMERICLLHELGNTWGDIGKAYGVSRRTIFRHLKRAGLNLPYREFTVILNDDLDELVSQFSVNHPFTGSEILRGHLESLGIHLPRRRVQESLRRVDVLGVLSRFVYRFLLVSNGDI